MANLNIWTRLFGDVRVTSADPDSFVLKKQNLMQEQAMGKNGWELIDDTSAHTPVGYAYCALQFLETSVINTVTGEGISASTVTVPAGLTILGHHTSITLTSGSCIAYKSVS